MHINSHTWSASSKRYSTFAPYDELYAVMCRGCDIYLDTIDDGQDEDKGEVACTGELGAYEVKRFLCVRIQIWQN